MFNPSLLTVAREAKGLTQASLAPMVGLSQAYLSQLEHGLKKPTDEIVIRLGEALDRPPRFFHNDSFVLGDGLIDFFHKKRRTLPVKPRRHSHGIVNVLRIEIENLLARVELRYPQPVPTISLDQVDSAGDAVLMTRAVWRAPDGPLADLVALVESLGVPVMVTNLQHRKLFAISVPLQDGTHLVVLNSMLSATDQRFALAHELGHLVMHGTMSDRDLEREADEFAGELLMPREQIRAEFRRLEFSDLGLLKQRWRVPMKALIYQAKALGSITDERATALYKQLSTLQGGRVHEPGEPIPERPRLVLAVINHYLGQLGYTHSQLAEAMATTEGRLRSFYLGESTPPKLRVVRADRIPFDVAQP